MDVFEFVDLKPPNQDGVIKSFPLPHIDEILNDLRKVTLFSKLGQASAYQQVRLDPSRRDLTALVADELFFCASLF